MEVQGAARAAGSQVLLPSGRSSVGVRVLLFPTPPQSDRVLQSWGHPSGRLPRSAIDFKFILYL